MVPKICCFLLLFLFTAKEGYAQNEAPPPHKNILHIEAGGMGGYGSLNYEREVPLARLFTLSGRIGISTIRIYDYTRKFNPDLLFPIAINGYYGKDHKLQLGFGQLISSGVRASHTDGTPKRASNLHTSITLGYRYKKDAGRLVLGISFTPILEFQETIRYWGAVTVGYAF